jgi:transposase
MSDTELLHKSKPSPVHRVEVFTGTGRRRSWTAEQKARIIAESHVGGDTVSAIARRHGLTAQQLFGWRRAAQRMASESEQSGALQSGALFAPVIVERPRRPSHAPIAAQLEGSPTIEIVIGVATVRIPPGIDAATLTTVLRAVRAAT